MWWVNGEPSDHIPASDRGLAYGDGIFETMRVVESGIPLIDAHIERLEAGALQLGLDISLDKVRGEVSKALAWIRSAHLRQAVIKLIITRSGDAAGYAANVNAESNIYLKATELHLLETTHPLRIAFCKHVLPKNKALAGIKHLNRLDQVMASQELGSDYDEGLLLDDDGLVIEGISSNLFLIHQNKVATPRLEYCGVNGVMRGFLTASLPENLNLQIEEKDIRPEDVLAADEIFFANAVRGVRSVGKIENMDVEVWRCSNTVIGDQVRAMIQSQLGEGFCSF